MNPKISAAIDAVTQRDYLGFSKALSDEISDRTAAHPAVVAYRYDIKYFSDVTDALKGVSKEEPEVVEPNEEAPADEKIDPEAVPDESGEPDEPDPAEEDEEDKEDEKV